MKTMLGLLAMLVLGVALPALLSGTLDAPRVAMALARTVPDRLDAHSFALGTGAGFLLCLLVRVSWRGLPQRLVGWALEHRTDFRLIGWGAAFLAVLFIY